MSPALTITLLGTGSPLPDSHRAGPATLITGGGEQYLVDAGRGVLMRLAAAGSAAGDTVPCAGLDELCAGAQALVHTAIRKDVIEQIPLQRMQDTLDYHSSPEKAAQTAQRAGMETLVLTHYVPAFASGEGNDWRQLAAAHFDGAIELGDDLHRVEVRRPGTLPPPQEEPS